MGPNAANGMPGMDMNAAMQGHGGNGTPGTEYTLQGVMRFLQTEWHRHERDRNSWEIEKQEMKGRIANLEGQARRADATQKALRKYVTILERKVKDQATKLKGDEAVTAYEAQQESRAAKIQEQLRTNAQKHHIPGVEGLEFEAVDDEAHRQDLKGFLDQAQSEFMYLMITPANPQPPRDSPPLPMIEDLREVDQYGMHNAQPMERQFPLRPAQNQAQEMAVRQQLGQNHAPMPPMNHNYPPKQQAEMQQALEMTRSNNEQQQQQQQQMFQPSWAPLVSERAISETPESYQAAAALGSMEGPTEVKEKRQPAEPETDGWEFPEGTFPEPGTSQPLAQDSSRPDKDVFPTADNLPKSPSRPANSNRRKGSMSRRRSSGHELALDGSQNTDSGSFKLRFGLRGHLDTVRTVIFSGGGSPGEPEICTAGDDGTIKRFHIPRLDSVSNSHASDLDVTANFTHRGHAGAVLALTSWSPSPNFSTGGRAQGDGWIFSGGQDARVRVWERGRVDPKATLEGHTDAVWALCVLPATLGSVFGTSSSHGSADRILLVSGAADGSVRLWSVSAPPQLSSPQPGSNRAMSGRGGRVRGNSMSSGSGFSNTPQASVASNSPCAYTLIHVIRRADGSTASPTCIAPLNPSGESFVVSYSDATVLVYDTQSGDQLGSMDSTETYDKSMKTSINAVVSTTMGLDQGNQGHANGMSEEDTASGPTGGGRASSGVEGTIISGHEDCYVRFFDANSGQCTYNMLAHPDAISSLSLSPDGRELVSAGHDASLRFWSLEKRTCTQEITSHRVMRGEGVCSCVWSSDGKWVVSGGGDGLVKVFAR